MYMNKTRFVALTGAILASVILLSSPASAVIEISSSFGGTTYTNLGNRFEVVLNATTKGNNSKKQSCGRSYMRIGAANMKIVDAQIGTIPNSSINREPDGTYVIQTPSKYDCIPDGDHVVAKFTADTVITGNASIYSTNGTIMMAHLMVNLAPKVVTVYPVLCPEGRTGTPPNCTIMQELDDVCPNIGGTQTAVPSGMKKNEAGDCVKVENNEEETPEEDYSVPKFLGLQSEESDKTRSITGVGYVPMLDSILLAWDMRNGLTEPKVQFAKVGETLRDTPEGPKIENSKASITLSRLVPFTEYKVTITGKNAKDETAKYSGIVRTRGYPVEIVIRQLDSPRSAAKVTLGGKSDTTDSYGLVKLESPSGKIPVQIEIGEVNETHTIDVKNATIDESTGAFRKQEFTINISPPPATPWWVYALIAAGGLAVAGGVGFVVWRKLRRGKAQTVAAASPASSDPFQNLSSPAPAPGQPIPISGPTVDTQPAATPPTPETAPPAPVEPQPVQPTQPISELNTQTSPSGQVSVSKPTDSSDQPSPQKNQ